MRKVDFAQSSVDALLCFNRHVTEKTLLLAIEFNRNPGVKIESTAVYRTLEAGGYHRPFCRAMRKTRNKQSVECRVREIARLNTCTSLIQDYIDYKLQCHQLQKKSYDLHPLGTDQRWRPVIVDIYYEVLFSDARIWTMLGHAGFGRRAFRDDFIQQNTNSYGTPLMVCPYCDLETITTTGSSVVEHFLPKAKFPYLSMNPYNLFPSCYSCNNPSSGKGARTRVPVAVPCTHEVGAISVFEVDCIVQAVRVDADIMAAKNYLALLNLQDRYKEKSVYQNLQSRMETLHLTFARSAASGELSPDELSGYLESTRQVQPLYYLTRSECFRCYGDTEQQA